LPTPLEYRPEKDIDGFVQVTRTKTAPPDVEAHTTAGAKRSSVFFDAEKEENKEESKTTDNVWASP
jgi:hypothetical protein